MGLRMRLFKKRLKAFVSNWLGVIIATIIVIISATFGGMYLYARSRIDNTLNFVTQVINLRYPDGLDKTGTTPDPLGYIYHIILQVYNPYGDTVDVAVSNITFAADAYTFPVSQNGSWDKTVKTGYEIFEGDITIDAKTFATLADKEQVDVEIKGTILGSGQYKWIQRQNTRPFAISIPVHFVLNP